MGHSGEGGGGVMRGLGASYEVIGAIFEDIVGRNCGQRIFFGIDNDFEGILQAPQRI
jgi:hypothetical protein